MSNVAAAASEARSVEAATIVSITITILSASRSG
jgi:hypothetical protein